MIFLDSDGYIYIYISDDNIRIEGIAFDSNESEYSYEIIIPKRIL